jgi:hypothetical protein
MTKEFDPEKPVVLRGGEEARILCTNLKGKKNIVAAIIPHGSERELVTSFYPNGQIYENEKDANDLINIPESEAEPVELHHDPQTASIMAKLNVHDEQIKSISLNNAYNIKYCRELDARLSLLEQIQVEQNQELHCCACELNIFKDLDGYHHIGIINENMGVMDCELIQMVKCTKHTSFTSKNTTPEPKTHQLEDETRQPTLKVGKKYWTEDRNYHYEITRMYGFNKYKGEEINDKTETISFDRTGKSFLYTLKLDLSTEHD